MRVETPNRLLIIPVHSGRGFIKHDDDAAQAQLYRTCEVVTRRTIDSSHRKKVKVVIHCDFLPVTIIIKIDFRLAFEIRKVQEKRSLCNNNIYK